MEQSFTVIRANVLYGQLLLSQCAECSTSTGKRQNFTLFRMRSLNGELQVTIVHKIF